MATSLRLWAHEPVENPHCFYCQICRRNVSFYGKEAAVVKRHYSSLEHFRNDQRWRYTHLSRTDPVSQIVSQRVRLCETRRATSFANLNWNLNYLNSSLRDTSRLNGFQSRSVICVICEVEVQPKLVKTVYAWTV